MTKDDLKKEIDELRESAGNVNHHGYIVWNTQQIKEVIDEYDKDNGITKIEITHGFEPGKKCYHVSVWRMSKFLNK